MENPERLGVGVKDIIQKQGRDGSGVAEPVRALLAAFTGRAPGEAAQ